jgi:hypothetical protein
LACTNSLTLPRCAGSNHDEAALDREIWGPLMRGYEHGGALR